MRYTQALFLASLVIYGVTLGSHNETAGEFYAIALMILSLVLGYIDLRKEEKFLKQLEDKQKELEAEAEELNQMILQAIKKAEPKKKTRKNASTDKNK